jgi:hypothetical protein
MPVRSSPGHVLIVWQLLKNLMERVGEQKMAAYVAEAKLHEELKDLAILERTLGMETRDLSRFLARL